jgi:osmotically-inducible protein OsmY/sporulation protein YlmC with PRC-barrel domain
MEPRLKITIGAPVESSDGPFGHVRQAILSPHQRCVLALVVRAGFPPRDVVVPIEQVADADDRRVHLRLSRADLERQPPLDPSHYVALAEHRQGYGAGEALAAVHGGLGDEAARALVTTHLGATARIAHQSDLASETIALRRGQPVWATDERAGRIDLLLLDPAAQVRHFVIRKGRLFGRDVIVPVDWVRHIDERGVWLAIERRALDRLPSYRPDSAIAADVDQALWDDEVIRELDFETIDAVVRDGVVTLSGYAATPVSKARAERAARRIEGVQGVVNQLVSDGEVVSAVAQALAQNPRTRTERIFVASEHGVVTLRGAVSSAEVRAAAEEVAAGVGQVRAVVNMIQAPGVAPAAEDQRVLQPRVGQEVYAADMLVGRVERVIISPRHRRVTALIAHGDFPDPARADPSMLPDAMPKHERHVVIPIDAVCHVTVGGVLLNTSGIEAARCPDFAPGDFVAPDSGWQPPYPYTHADVLLDLGRAAAARGDHQLADSGQALAVERTPEGAPIWQVIRHGMPVLFRDGGAGVVDHLWIDPTSGTIRQIVVRAVGPLPKDTVIPLDWVRRIDESGVFVDVGVEQLAALPAAPAARGRHAAAIAGTGVGGGDNDTANWGAGALSGRRGGTPEIRRR